MASGLMSIRYSDDGIASRAGDAYRELNDVRTSLGNIRKKVNGLPERSSRNNLSNASAFITKKTQQYEKREAALQTLQQRANVFTSHVETTENKLSDEIRQSYEAFHQVTGIGKTKIAAIFEKLQGIARDVWKFFTETLPEQIKKTLENFCKMVKNIAEYIVHWVRDHWEQITYFVKFAAQFAMTIVQCCLTVVAIASAILAPTPWTILAAISGVIGAFDSFISLFRQGKAMSESFNGNSAAAREIDSQSNAEFLFGDSAFGVGAYNAIMAIGSILGLVSGIGTLVSPQSAAQATNAVKEIGELFMNGDTFAKIVTIFESFNSFISAGEGFSNLFSGPGFFEGLRGVADIPNFIVTIINAFS
ncbi:MAG: hypothetical protein IKK75_09795 [Clostridia bacterium]|nr:hypothetical protein [Clostridia bacterium]